MGIHYYVYAEVNIAGKWYSLHPFFPKPDGKYLTGAIYHAQSVFREVDEELSLYAVGKGVPLDMSDGLRQIFSEKLDEQVPNWWAPLTWAEYYKETLYYVDFGQAIKPKVKKDKPYKYEGYVQKQELANFEFGETDAFAYWLTEDEYVKLDEKEKRKFTFYRWNDPYGTYGIYVTLVEYISMLTTLFADIMWQYLDRSVLNGIADSQIRVFIFRN